MSREEVKALFADLFGESSDGAVNRSAESEKPSTSSALFNADYLKRNLSFGDLQTVNAKRQKLNKSVSPDPAAALRREIRLLNGDLIEARAKSIRLEQRLANEVFNVKEITLRFESEKDSLISQKITNKKTISILKFDLKQAREREHEAKAELSEKTKEFHQKNYKLDKNLQQIKRENSELQDKIIEMHYSHKSQIAETMKDMDELALACESGEKKLTKLRDDHSKLLKQTVDLGSLQEKLDKQGLELLFSNSRVKELEYEIGSYKDWLVQAKTAQKRLNTLPDLERELARMKTQERHLREIAQGKLLMEEKMYSLKQQVASLEPMQQELQKLQTQCALLDDALNEWKDVLRIVIPNTELLESEEPSVLEKMRGSVAPRMVLAALQRAQETELLAINDQMEAASKVVQMKNEVSTATHELEKAKNKLADLEKLEIGQRSLIERLKIRLSLVSRERDSYRNHLDFYDKELTTTMFGEGQSENPLQTRVECLEKMLQEYRDLAEKLEKDIVGMADVEASPSLRDQLSRLRDEIQVLKRDNDLLRARKDQLELQFEYRALKGDYNSSKDKILRMTNNQASTAQSDLEKAEAEILRMTNNQASTAQSDLEKAEAEILRMTNNQASTAQSDLEKAEAEVKRLCEVIKRLESEGAEMSQRLSESMVETGDSKELQAMKEVFTTSSKDFRKVCFSLLGYKIHQIGQEYRLTSIYAESPEEYLLFTLTDGKIKMVQTDYLSTINELVNLYLRQNKSFPRFLSAHTIELSKRTIMMQEDKEEEKE